MLNPLPRLGIFDCMVLHKNKVLCFCQINKLCFQPLCRLIVISHIRILIHRIKSIPVNIRRYISCLWKYLFKFFLNCTVLWKTRQKLFINFLIALSHLCRTSIQTNQQIQSKSHDRKCEDQKNPGHLDRRCDRRCIHIQNDNQSQHSCQKVQCFCISVQSGKQRNNKHNL